LGVILDTCFVIDAEREARTGKSGKMAAFLDAHLDAPLFLTFTISGELACGNSAAARPDWQRLISPYVVLPWVPEISFEYGCIYRELARKGELIGTNDLWIAAAARFHGLPLATNNAADFSRVRGLTLVPY
jgi:tRNA(fMet)-specific endonuclease VapC